METTKRTIILLLLALLTTGTTQSAEKQAATISATRTASCLVKITCDPAILPLNLEIINYLMHSSSVGGKARREVLSITPDQDYDLFTIEYVQPLASGDPGGVVLPTRNSQTGRSSGLEDRGMDEYEYAMMMEAEMEKRRAMPTRPATSSRVSRSSRGTSSRSTRRTPSTSRTVTATPESSPDERAYLFSLNVHLPEDIRPLARMYMNALVDNLRQALMSAYDEYEKKLENMLLFAESRRDHAQSQLAEVMKQVKTIEPPPEIKLSPADASVYERLEQIVDLPDISTQTSFADVIEQLKTAVEPPLQIQPNWKDLLENAEVEQTTPAGMDPLFGVKVRKALEILLASVSSDFAKLKYVVDDGVIVVGTQDVLPSKMIMRVYDIPALAYSPGGAGVLVEAIQSTIDPESWFELGAGEGTVTPYPSQQPRKLAIYQTYENHQKIQKFLESIKMDIPTGMPSEIPEEILLSEKNNLIVEKQDVEMDIARIQSRIPAIEEQIVIINRGIDQKVNNDQVNMELRKILAYQMKNLEKVKKLIDGGTVSNSELADAEEKLARAKIELARRREQIGASAGADQLAKFSNEMATLAIDLAEKKAVLKNIDERLNRIEQQLTASEILDPQVSQIRLAAKALEIVNRRVNELNALALNVQPPSVSMLGAE